MTTLGALSVGLLVLVLIVAAAIALLARSQRRSPRGPEQPRTVADLVRMREAAAEARAAAGTAAAGTPAGPAAATDVAPVAEPGEAAPSVEAEESRRFPSSGEPLESEEPTELVAPDAVAAPGSEVAGSPAAGESPEPDAEAELPEAAPAAEAPQGSGSLQDTPWARAARMADPMGEWTASARAARDRAEPSGPRQAPGVVPKAQAKDPADPPRPQLSLLDPDRAALAHDTTTIAHLPKGFAQALPSVGPAAPTPPAASESPASEARAGIAHSADVAAAPAEPQAAAAADDITAPVALPLASTEPEARGEPVVDAQASPDPLDDDTVQIGPPPGAGTDPQAPVGSDGLDDSVTVNLAPPVAGQPADPAGRREAAQSPATEPSAVEPSAAQPPEEPTAPVDPTAFAAFETAIGQSTDPSACSGATRLVAAADVAEVAAPGVVAVAAPSEAAAPSPAPVVGNGVAYTNGHGIAAASTNRAATPVPTPARVAGRVRRSPADTAAEQAAADLALLRTFGVAGPGHTAAADAEVELEGCSSDDAEPSAGRAQPVAFRIVGRDGRGVAGTSVTLLDDHGREISGTAADANGAGSLTARRPGGYMLVAAADGYQPGAVTIAVADAPVDTEIPLTRSGSIAGSVCGEDGLVVGAHVVLVQDGEIVETAESGVDGAYVFADLAAGEYGLSVTASECEPAAVVLRLADEADLRHDVDLDPVGLPAGGATGDVMIGHL